VAKRERRSSVEILSPRDDARAVGGAAGLRFPCLQAVSVAFLPDRIPIRATVIETISLAGDGAENLVFKFHKLPPGKKSPRFKLFNYLVYLVF
jgi:hypothetical protein